MLSGVKVKSKALMPVLMLLLTFVVSLIMLSPSAYAVDELDSLSGGSSDSTSEEDQYNENLRKIDEEFGLSSGEGTEDTSTELRNTGDPDKGGIDLDVEKDEDSNIGNSLKGVQVVTPDNIASAQKTMSPVINVIGYITGIALVFLIMAIGVMTVLDLIYITVPFTRQYLANPNANGAGGGMPAFSGPGPGQAQGGTRKQLVSDEATKAVAMYGGAAPSAAGGAPGMAGMGGGFPGGFHGGGMMQQNQTNNAERKSPIRAYLVSRTKFIIMLAIAMVVLTSSLLMDTGLNIAQWILGLLNMVNGWM